MAEKDQKPTPKRLREARKKGEVVLSRDLSSTVVFIVVTVSVWLLGTVTFSMLHELWLHATSTALLANPDDRFPELLLHTAEVALWGMLPIMLIAALAGFVGSFFQVGGVFAWSRLKPDINRLNPAQGFKRIFSTRNFVNLLKMCLKTMLIAVLLAIVVYTFMDTAMRLGYGRPATAMAVGARALFEVFAWAGVIFVLMSGVDYAHEHYEFMKEQRMSIEDVRREYKEDEGDPINRSRRRSAHIEMIFASVADRVRVASAVIHSPRVAVALQYLGEKDLPRVIARGEGEVAAQIRRFAEQSMIPMELDAALAERLYEEVPEDQHIPRALYAPVATLLRWAQGNE